MLQAGEMSNSSSNNSLNATGGGSRYGQSAVARSRGASVTGSREDLDRDPPVYRSQRTTLGGSATLGRKGSSGVPSAKNGERLDAIKYSRVAVLVLVLVCVCVREVFVCLIPPYRCDAAHSVCVWIPSTAWSGKKQAREVEKRSRLEI